MYVVSASTTRENATDICVGRDNRLGPTDNKKILPVQTSSHKPNPIDPLSSEALSALLKLLAKIADSIVE
jgi:hypothetical protein